MGQSQKSPNGDFRHRDSHGRHRGSKIAKMAKNRQIWQHCVSIPIHSQSSSVTDVTKRGLNTNFFFIWGQGAQVKLHPKTSLCDQTIVAIWPICWAKTTNLAFFESVWPAKFGFF
jgi:hypothetical protein